MIGYVTGLIGCWILSDAVYSITLYLNAPSHDGLPRQTWKHDHWVRLLRGILGATLIYFGAILFG